MNDADERFRTRHFFDTTRRDLLRSAASRVRDGLKGSDVGVVVSGLSDLLVDDPSCGLWLAQTAGVFPHLGKDPKNPEMFGEQFRTLLPAVAAVLDNGKMRPEAVRLLVELMTGLMRIDARFRTVRSAIGTLSFYQRPVDEALVSIAAFVEAQSELARERIEALTGAGNVFNPVDFVVPKQPVSGGGSTSHPVGQWEACVDVCESVVRKVLHGGAAADAKGRRGGVTKDELEDAVLWARRWHACGELANHARYRGVRIVRRAAPVGSGVGSTEVDVVLAACPEAHAAERVGDARLELFKGQEVYPVHLIGERNLAEGRRLTAEAAASVTLPAAGGVWDGRVARNPLRRLLAEPWEADFVRAWIRARHLAAWADGLKIQSPHGRPVPWEAWIGVRIALMRLCGVLHTAAHAASAPPEARVVRVGMGALTDLLRDVLPGDLPAVAEDAMRAMVLDPKKKGIDWWTRPLITLSGDDVLLVPSLIVQADPTRAIELAIAVENQNGPTAMRSAAFVEHLAALLQDAGATVHTGVTYDATDGSQAEHDVVAWWAGRLVLVEAKCLMIDGGAYRHHRNAAELEYAVCQINRRVRLLREPENWRRFVAAAPALALPTSHPGDERVLPVAASNDLRFTGISIDGVPLVDDLVFGRYLSGDRTIAMYLTGDDAVRFAGDLVTLRSTEEVEPNGWHSYLFDPPQVRFMRDRLSYHRSHVEGFDDHVPLIVGSV